MNTFQKARIKLTLWYVIIAASLLGLATLSAINAEKAAFNRIEAALGDSVQRPRLTALLQKSLDEFETRFRNRLLLLDFFLLGLTGVGGYVLSNRTLKPIQKMIKNQRDFSLDVSHELRTPLTTIGLEIEAVKRSHNLPNEAVESFTNIQSEVTRMRRIVDGLLTLAREEGLPSREKWKITDLTEIVEYCVNQTNSLFKEKGINLTYSRDLHYPIFCDEEEIKRVILIFIDNASKYTPSGGFVKITLKKTTREAIVEITDSGVGIEKSELAHVFERFYRGKSNTAVGGTGLGLAIAKKIIESHHGKVSVESTLGKGSTFRLYLPLRS